MAGSPATLWDSPPVFPPVEELLADLPFASNISPVAFGQGRQRPAPFAVSRRIRVERVEGNHLGKRPDQMDRIALAAVDASPFQKRASDLPGKGESDAMPRRSTIVAGRSRKLTASVTTCFEGNGDGGMMTRGT